MPRSARFTLFVLAFVAAVAAAAPTFAALPRTYQVQRIDSPAPGLGARFGGGLANLGDLNADGKDEVAMGQRIGSPGLNGQVYIFSGATGGLLTTIVAPDGGGAGQTAGSALFGTPFVDRMADIGSCTGGTTGVLCPLGTIGAPDGVPEIAIGARGIDGTVIDQGRAYVYDGATRALLKRIDLPVADRTATAVSNGGTWFGRIAYSPAAQPPCAGNYGIGACPVVTTPVLKGDLDGAGQPDIVVGASRFTEDATTAHPSSPCAANPPATCIRAGRSYVYRGEDIAGSDPSVNLATPLYTIKNLEAQEDDPETTIPTNSELFGNAAAPVGDVGSCTVVVTPGDRCPSASAVGTLDGKPEVLISAFRVDAPINNPDPSSFDVGVNFLVDGGTGSILYTYQHPEPQPGSLFGNGIQGPAAGDLGDTALPDMFIAAGVQNGAFKGQGRGYFMTGNFKAEPTTINFGFIDDPTPSYGGNFGSPSAGVGDLVTDASAPKNELLVGETGILEPENTSLLSDVHFFNAGTFKSLQNIPDPDAQANSAFGNAIAPMGDLNSDGFLDFAVGSPQYDATAGGNEGRFYVFLSDNSPGPASAAAQSGRTIELEASRSSVKKGRSVRLTGFIEAFANKPGCEPNMQVTIQRRRAGKIPYKTLAQVATAADGSFSTKAKATHSFVYRAQVVASPACAAATSNVQKVSTR